MQCRDRADDQLGFSLIEVLVALALIVILLTSVAQLFAFATASNVAARARAAAALLAEAKLEELRELSFGFDRQGIPSTDLTTDTTGDVSAAGGSGLTPGGSVVQTIAGYSDYVDPFGRRTDAARTAFVRRWSIQPLPSDPANALVIRVAVLRRQDAVAGRDPATIVSAVHLITVRTRKAR